MPHGHHSAQWAQRSQSTCAVRIACKLLERRLLISSLTIPMLSENVELLQTMYLLFRLHRSSTHAVSFPDATLLSLYFRSLIAGMKSLPEPSNQRRVR
jgi:hypothetical protein